MQVHSYSFGVKGFAVGSCLSLYLQRKLLAKYFQTWSSIFLDPDNLNSSYSGYCFLQREHRCCKIQGFEARDQSGKQDKIHMEIYVLANGYNKRISGCYALKVLDIAFK